MGNKAFLAVVVFVALVAVFFLFGGMELFTGSDAGGDDPGGTPDGGSLTAETDGTEGGDVAETVSRGPVLFGRSRAERAGIGGLYGRVMDFDTSKAIGQAVVVIAGTGYAEETTAEQVASDANGYFRFEKVAAGDAYSVHVTDPQGRQRTVSSIAVDADSEKDLGVVWMGKAGALEGVVLDAAGLPVAGASVQVHEGGGSLMELLRNLSKVLEVMDQDAKPVAEATSERTGLFLIEELAPGPYTLVVRAPGYELTTRKMIMTSAGAAGGKITLRLPVGRSIVGIVVDERDRPVEGARVACMEKNDMESVFFGRQYSVTDSDGRFEIASPPSQGALNVIVAAEGYPTLFTEARLGGGDLRFVLVGGTEVLLRVLEKGTELPIEGARLMGMFAKTLRAAGSNMGFASGVTDERGEALVLARPGKLQMLFLNHSERGSSIYNPMMGAMGQAMALEGPKDTTVKGSRTVLEFHLGAGITVVGTVKDQDGKALAGVRVSTVGMLGGGTSAMTDDEGKYELTNQSPPIMMVTAAAPGFVPVPDPAAMAAMMEKPQDGVITRDVTMRRAASISGRVVDPRGRPMPGVEVKTGGGMAQFAMFMGDAKQTITSATGRYVLDGVLPGARMHVMARTQGYLTSKTETFEVGEGVVEAPDLVLQVGSRVVVRVERPDGSAVREARVEVSVSASERIQWDLLGGTTGFADVLTNAAGKADIEDLPDGRVTLTATKEGFAAARTNVETKHAEGAKHEALLKLREAVTLSGRVVDQDGKPLKGVVVQTRRPATSSQPDEPPTDVFVPRVTDTTDERGRFELPGLPTVPVQLVVTAEGHKPIRREVAADGGDVQIRLEKVGDDVQARVKAIDAELMTIYGQLGSVKDEAERNALGQRMLQLQQEKAKLEKESPRVIGPGEIRVR